MKVESECISLNMHRSDGHEHRASILIFCVSIIDFLFKLNGWLAVCGSV